MDRTERVARTLCKADGRDPDEVVVAYRADELPGGAVEGVGPNVRWVGPRWRRYVAEAARLVAAWEH